MRLPDWLSATNTTMAAFAKKVGVTHSTVSRWCAGEIFPQSDKLVLIREATDGKVSANDFMPPSSAAASGTAGNQEAAA